MLPIAILVLLLIGWWGFFTRIVPFFIAGILWLSVGFMWVAKKACLYLHHRRECDKMRHRLTAKQFENWKRLNRDKIMNANWIGHDEDHRDFQANRKRRG